MISPTTTLPASWIRVPLGEFGPWIGGGTPSKAVAEFWTNGTIPWVSPKDMKTFRLHSAIDSITESAVTASSTRMVPPGSVLIVVRSGILQRLLPVAINDVPAALNQDMKALVPPEGVIPEYVAYGLLAHERTVLQEYTKTGTTVQNINVPEFLRMGLPLAPTDEQRRIVEELEKQFTRLDAAVAGLRRVQKALKRYRAAVLQAACSGRLVPTEAELARAEGRTYETGEQLLARILAERRTHWEAAGRKGKYQEPAPLDTTDLPDLPEGWTRANVEQIIREPTCNGLSVKGSDTPPGIAALRLGAMSERGFNYTQVRYLPVSEVRCQTLWVQEGDFFVSRGNGTLGLLARGTTAQAPPFRVIFPDTMIRVRITPQLSATGWMATCWQSRGVRGQIETKAKTTAGIYKISQVDLSGMHIPLPPLIEQERIVAEVERRLSVVEEVEAAVATNLKRAERLRQAILKRAFEGRLVPQDPNDEPASVLLRRIRDEPETATTSGKARAMRKNNDGQFSCTELMS